MRPDTGKSSGTWEPLNADNPDNLNWFANFLRKIEESDREFIKPPTAAEAQAQFITMALAWVALPFLVTALVLGDIRNLVDPNHRIKALNFFGTWLKGQETKVDEERSPEKEQQLRGEIGQGPKPGVEPDGDEAKQDLKPGGKAPFEQEDGQAPKPGAAPSEEDAKQDPQRGRSPSLSQDDAKSEASSPREIGQPEVNRQTHRRDLSPGQRRFQRSVLFQLAQLSPYCHVKYTPPEGAKASQEDLSKMARRSPMAFLFSTLWLNNHDKLQRARANFDIDYKQGKVGSATRAVRSVHKWFKEDPNRRPARDIVPKCEADVKNLEHKYLCKDMLKKYMDFERGNHDPSVTRKGSGFSPEQLDKGHSAHNNKPHWWKSNDCK